MTSPERQANALGALALVVADQIAAATSKASGQSVSGAATLSALRHFLDAPTLDELGRVLGLTPSGTVRLVDRLAADGLVRRGAGADSRSRSVRLTRKGRVAADRVNSARAAVLNQMLHGLSPAERSALDQLLAKLMSAVVERKSGGAWICRLCDTVACRRDAGLCPAANAAAAQYRAPVFSP